MSDDTTQRLQDKYHDQLSQRRQQSGQHPDSGFQITAPEKYRIGVKVEMFHQPPSGQPSVLNNVFHRWLDSTEQAYQRYLQLTQEWQPLDHGWLPADAVSMLVIKNTECHAQVQPSPEEAAELQTHIIVIGFQVGFDGHNPIIRPLILIRPGEHAQFEPYDLSDLYIRCEGGTKVKATMLLSPE